MDFDLYKRIKRFDKPFAYIVMNYRVDTFCSYCLKKPHQTQEAPGAKLHFCAQCKFARYCGKDCQKLAWKDHHKQECARLKRVFPNLPITEVLLVSRILDKLLFIQRHGDVHNWQKERKFDDLLTHEAEILVDEAKMQFYAKFQDKLKIFYFSPLDNDSAAVMTDRQIFLTFCRTWINSHSIHTSAGTEVGMALDLGVSYYDHSCRPNLTLVFDGFRAVLRPLTPTVNAQDYQNAFIAYVDVGRSKFQRRKELWSKWYFWCRCNRCMDPDDDRLTSIKCQSPKCDEPIVTAEDWEPTDIVCPRCAAIVSKEKVREAQEFMKNLPTKYSIDADEEQVEKCRVQLEEAQKMLHSENIYYCRLQTAYMQMSGAKNRALQPDVQKMVYENYKRNFLFFDHVIRCLPQADRHVGYQLLHLVKSLIERGRREEAVQYAYEAMAIFEICFGLEHPYYLQTLALWTFLDNKSPKSDQELLSLMNFNYNTPVDISSYLEKAMMTTNDEQQQNIHQRKIKE